jgi:hypothetical protein
VASGYEKVACGVDPDVGWSPSSVRRRAQMRLDRAIFICAVLLHIGTVVALVRPIAA